MPGCPVTRSLPRHPVAPGRGRPGRRVAYLTLIEALPVFLRTPLAVAVKVSRALLPFFAPRFTVATIFTVLLWPAARLPTLAHLMGLTNLFGALAQTLRFLAIPRPVFLTLTLKVTLLPGFAGVDFGEIFSELSLAAWKVALTVVASSKVTWQVPVPEQPAPDQPVKVEPGLGVAVRTTFVKEG